MRAAALLAASLLAAACDAREAPAASASLLGKLDWLSVLSANVTVDVVLVGFEPGASKLGQPARPKANDPWHGEEEASLSTSIVAPGRAGRLAAAVRRALRWDGGPLAAALASAAREVVTRPASLSQAEFLIKESADAATAHAASDEQREGRRGEGAAPLAEAARARGAGAAGSVARGGAVDSTAAEHVIALLLGSGSGSAASARVHAPSGVGVRPAFRVTHARRQLWRAVQSTLLRQLHSPGPGGRHALDPEPVLRDLRAHHDTMGHAVSVFVIHPRILDAGPRSGSAAAGAGLVALPADDTRADDSDDVTRRVASRIVEAAGSSASAPALRPAAYAYKCRAAACGCAAAADHVRRVLFLDVGAGLARRVSIGAHGGLSALGPAAVRDAGLASDGPLPDEAGADPHVFPLGAATELADGIHSEAGAHPDAVAHLRRVVAAWTARVAVWVARASEAVIAPHVEALPEPATRGATRRARVLVLSLERADAQSLTDASAPPERLVDPRSSVRWRPCPEMDATAGSPGLGLLPDAECGSVVGCVGSCRELLRMAAAGSPAPGDPAVLMGSLLASDLAASAGSLVLGPGRSSSDLFRSALDDEAVEIVPAVLLGFPSLPTGKPAVLLLDGPLAAAAPGRGFAVAVRSRGTLRFGCPSGVRCGGDELNVDANRGVVQALADAILFAGWGIKSGSATPAECSGRPSMPGHDEAMVAGAVPWLQSHPRECWPADRDPVVTSPAWGPADDTSSLEPALALALGLGPSGLRPTGDGAAFHVADAVARSALLSALQEAVRPARVALLAAAAHSRTGATEPSFLGETALRRFREEWALLSRDLRRAASATAILRTDSATKRIGTAAAAAVRLAGIVTAALPAPEGRSHCPAPAVVEAATAEVVIPGIAAAVCAAPSLVSCKAPEMRFVSGAATAPQDVTADGWIPSAVGWLLTAAAASATGVAGWVAAPSLETAMLRGQAAPMRRGRARDLV